MTKQTFGPNLRARREAANISGNELARRTGIDQANVSKIERGIRSPSQSELERIASVDDLSVTLGELKAWAEADRLGEEGLSLLRKYVQGRGRPMDERELALELTKIAVQARKNLENKSSAEVAKEVGEIYTELFKVAVSARKEGGKAVVG